MQFSTVWKSRQSGKKRSVRKPKIPWERLGLTVPAAIDRTSSIETIRREVTALARYGVASDARIRSSAQESKSLSKKRQARGVGSRPRRTRDEQRQNEQ